MRKSWVFLAIFLLCACLLTLLGQDATAQIVRPAATPRAAATSRPAATLGRIPEPADDIEDISGWWSAHEDDEGVYTDVDMTVEATANDDVAYWLKDLSGGTLHVSQVTLGLRPLLKTSIDGHDALLFDGVNDVLTKTAVAPLGSGDAAWTIFFVGEIHDLNVDQNCQIMTVGDPTAAGSSAWLNVGMNLYGDKFIVHTAGPLGGSDATTDANSMVAVYDVQVIIRVRHTAGQVINQTQVWFDGVEKATGGSGSAWNMDASGIFRIGGQSGEEPQMYFREARIYSTDLSDARSDSIEDYLAFKWDM